ncbi:uncharacterized protein LOC112348341 isoform X2 [Selaginella moellendorffii]|uniref:uncharacterized protein LOC112348341 isoform X1 n=1 Tax=Selaginella moellendorffii TaxID=88036 RepID=UPI000D1CC1FA|nr:uncharacterized protein LOC112348341 isoform X1 [Selaginella moellendorffii]XP_024536450.1 uncharacterized protein LOC112348341 isoform X2 [Selaginella moellendorffii]|eukprot:XP_024536449.1 uncharacterized protein LOC112348341 isoform X1 [Selaginella moellendorffii]
MRKRSMQESSEEEEEEQRLRSCVVDYSSLTPSAARPIDRQVEEGAADDHHLKFYQVRLQDHLHEFLDKTVEIIRAEEEPDRPVAAPSQEEDDGFHLFRKAPAGITMIERVRDGSLEHRASGKRYIHSTRGWFSSGKNSLENVVIDGESVRVEAEKAREKALAAWQPLKSWRLLQGVYKNLVAKRMGGVFAPAILLLGRVLDYDSLRGGMACLAALFCSS